MSQSSLTLVLATAAIAGILAAATAARANIFFTNSDMGTVEEYTNSGELVNDALISGLFQPSAIAVSGDDLFVLSNGNHTISEFDITGAPVNEGLITGLNDGPTGIAISGSYLFVTNYGDPDYVTRDTNIGTVSEYTMQGQIVSSSLITGLHSLTCISISGSELFVGDQNGNVDEFTVTGAPIRVVPITPGAAVQYIAASGSYMWVGDSDYTTSGDMVSGAIIFHDPTTAAAVLGTDVYIASSDPGWVGEYTASGDVINGSLISSLYDFYGGTYIEGIAVTPEPAVLGVFAVAALPWRRSRGRRRS